MKQLCMFPDCWFVFLDRVVYVGENRPSFKALAWVWSICSHLDSPAIHQSAQQSETISLAWNKISSSTSYVHFVQLISLVCAPMAGTCLSSCDYLWRHPSCYLLFCVVRPKMWSHGKSTNGPNHESKCVWKKMVLNWQFIQASDNYSFLLN